MFVCARVSFVVCLGVLVCLFVDSLVCLLACSMFALLVWLFYLSCLRCVLYLIVGLCAYFFPPKKGYD